jgi:hypothetical protein
MPPMRKGLLPGITDVLERCELTRLTYSPLKPAELQVLRAQYEKEGDYVGIQTKFNFAWV